MWYMAYVKASMPSFDGQFQAPQNYAAVAIRAARARHSQSELTYNRDNNVYVFVGCYDLKCVTATFVFL